MNLAIIEKEGMSSFVAELLQRRNAVVGVKEQAAVSLIPGDQGFFTYTPLNSPEELTLSFDVTLIPPKKYLLPAYEKLLSFDLPPKSIQAEIPKEGLIILGVHPYDIVAINQMDKIFSAVPQDNHYLERRKKITIIGLDPVNVAPRAFWSSMGAYAAKNGFDLMLTDIGQCYVVEVGTKKGSSLLKLARQTREATPAEVKERERVRAEVKKRCDAHRLNFSYLDLPTLLEASEGHVVWEEKAYLCFSCGACNLVCPTCYCFDVQDEVSLDRTEGARYRTWDGCLLSDFARVAGGGNFRGHRADRYRHRFYRKGQFIYRRFGDIACVGCGRCSAQCPSDIADPLAVFNRLQEGI